jgi:hypothetical protein
MIKGKWLYEEQDGRTRQTIFIRKVKNMTRRLLEKTP